MGDSDDEYDRKRRDKFRGERAADAAYSNRGSERAVRTREDWQERDGWSRPRPRDYPGRVRDRGYSPSIEPAMKRPRTDYYGGGGDYFGGGGFAASAYHQAAHRREMAANIGGGGGDSSGGQPPMLSFKSFLATQDDNISDSEAIEKYNDYKLEFQRQQLNEFFVAHKDDEWFRIKYHPEDSAKRKEEQTNFIKKRVEIFAELSKDGRLSTSLDCVHTNALVKLLDTVVTKLEGGTEEDIAALDKEYEEKEEPRVKEKDKESSEKKAEKPSSETKENMDGESGNSNKEEGEEGEVDMAEKPTKNDDNKSDDGLDEDNETKKQEVNGENVKDRKDVDADATANKDKAEDGSNSEEDNKEAKIKKDTESSEKMEVNDKKTVAAIAPETENVKTTTEADMASSKAVEGTVDKKKDAVKSAKEKKRKRSRSYSGSSSNNSSSSTGSGSSSDSDSEHDKDKEDKQKNNAEEATNGKNDDGEADDKNGQDKDTNKDGNKIKEEDEDDKSTVVKIKDEDDKDKKDEKKAPLHKTTSIFLRSLPPTITRQEVEAMCSRYGGFLRVALADPQPERRWQRRGWVTFRRDANIKEICWALNNARLRDCDLGAIMNRDLSRRIRPVSGVAAHRCVVRTDIRIAARVAVHMDGKYGLWKKEDVTSEDEINTTEDRFTPFGFLSYNPVLHNITDHLIEEASAEEDLLLGLEPTDSDDAGASDGTNVQVERDNTLISVLDRIILYLRIVHSIDYYNHCEYPNEDEMPSRCGILHARGPTPTARADISHLLGTQAENRMANFLPEAASANDAVTQASGGGTATSSKDSKKTDNEQKLITLAVKDVDVEIDKFIQANTKELAKDKWLCPLSGKKFKGPDFVRKHIFNKHAEKIDEVKKEVEFFNNYLKDSKRPAAADQHPQQQQQQQQQQQTKREELPSLGGGYGGHQQHSRSYGGGYGGGYMGRYGGYQGGYSRPHRGGYSHRAGRGGGGGVAAGAGGDYRPIIHYRDLDAPREPEEFI